MSDTKSVDIPDEAVEAGARALCSLAGYEWEGSGVHADVKVDFQAQLLEQARTILEAAAPIMRQAFYLEMNLRAAQDELRTAPIYRLGKIEDKR